jgi:hypothetical protein
LEDDALEQLTLDGTKHDDAYVDNLKKQLRSTLTRLREVETNFAKIKVKKIPAHMQCFMPPCTIIADQSTFMGLTFNLSRSAGML